MTTLATAAGFVAMSRFTIANGMAGEVHEAFRKRPHLVDAAAGFVRMEVICPRGAPEQIWLITFWTDEASYETWHRGHAYHGSHSHIPKGLKLVQGSTKIEYFDHISS